jgi:acyl dehydratase
LHLESVRNLRFEAVAHSYTRRESMLYALGLGYGSDPTDPTQLAYVYETNLRTVPSMCCVLAHPGFWAKNPALGIDWLKMLHGEQSFEIHSPIPPEGTVVGTYEIVAVEDKGAGKGAILHQLKKLHDKGSGQLLATVRSVLFLRGDGSCGSFGDIPASVEALPEHAPSSSCEIATLPQSALIYRLSGDYNPIHADPEAAAKAGFDAPILQGLCTLGVATRAILQTFASGTPEHLKSLFVRFSRPVFPGETIRTEFFATGREVRFRSRAVERDVIVLDRGSAVFAG